jgi:hypothetical protein
LAELGQDQRRSRGAKPTDDATATSLERRAAQVARRPKVDLAACPTLCLEPFAMTDPEAVAQKKQYLVESAPRRTPSYCAHALPSTNPAATPRA